MLNSSYKKRDYWDERYKNESSFEWFKDYKELKKFLLPYLNYQDQVLVLGCGNSPFSRHLFEDGFTNITNIDYSSVCIKNMTKTHTDCPSMKWMTMDISDLKFKESMFDIIIEKGTLDTILAGEKDVWNISNFGDLMIEKILNHVCRVLTPGGRFISVTFSQPHFRKQLYCRTRYQWGVTSVSLGSAGCFEYFLYAMTKGKALSASDAVLEEETICRRNKWEENSPAPITFDEDNNEDYLLEIDTGII